MPIDSSWISSGIDDRLSQIILDAKPVAAIVVAGGQLIKRLETFISGL